MRQALRLACVVAGFVVSLLLDVRALAPRALLWAGLILAGWSLIDLVAMHFGDVDTYFVTDRTKLVALKAALGVAGLTLLALGLARL